MTLYVTDLDGTLLDPSGRVSPASAAIISRLSRHGAMITVATARTPATVVPLLEHTFTVPPAIVMTGAALWRRDTASYTDVHMLTPVLYSAVLHAATGAGVGIFIYTLQPDGMLEVYFRGTPDAPSLKFAAERRGLKLKRFHFDHPRAHDPWIEGTVLVFATGPMERIEAMASMLEGTGCSVSCYPDMYNRSLGLIEVFAPGVSKAAALKELVKATGATRTIVFGDNLNDLPMMAEADFSVAVANALPQVLDSADFVIAPNSRDSVARFIEEDFKRNPR